MKASATLFSLLAMTAFALASPAAEAQVAKAQAVAGEKLDSGLGHLPPYAQWDDKTGRQPMRHRVAGESLDDGLGELPHYSKWLDRSGRNPMGGNTLSAGVSPR